MNSTLLIISELTNQNAQKALFTCVVHVYTIVNIFVSVGKDGPMNGEMKASSPQTGSGLSNKSAADKKTEAKSTDDNKQTAKPFDINDFFLSDTVLPFTGGGVSFSKLKCLSAFVIHCSS